MIFTDLTAFPDVKEIELDDWDEFVVLASDGFTHHNKTSLVSKRLILGTRDLGLPYKRTSRRICPTRHR
jgi:serine/threonine protein phosphatase PrpC